MLNKYSIKEGGQVISKANSVLKWSGWCTHTHLSQHLLPYKISLNS